MLFVPLTSIKYPSQEPPSPPPPKKMSILRQSLQIKKPNHKCRHYWCLIEFIDKRYSQYVGIFHRLCELFAPLTFSLG
jgi:hypothetical protein